jgi:hypothetical protein
LRKARRKLGARWRVLAVNSCIEFRL